MLFIMPEVMNSSSYVSSNRWLISIFPYNGLLAISKYRANITQCFYILTNLLYCLGWSNVLPTHIIPMTLLIKLVSKSNKLSNGPRFWGKSTNFPQTPLYDLGLKLLLGVNFKIVMTICILTITAFLADVRPFNGSD